MNSTLRCQVEVAVLTDNLEHKKPAGTKAWLGTMKRQVFVLLTQAALLSKQDTGFEDAIHLKGFSALAAIGPPVLTMQPATFNQSVASEQNRN